MCQVLTWQKDILQDIYSFLKKILFKVFFYCETKISFNIAVLLRNSELFLAEICIENSTWNNFQKEFWLIIKKYFPIMVFRFLRVFGWCDHGKSGNVKTDFIHVMYLYNVWKYYFIDRNYVVKILFFMLLTLSPVNLITL